MKLLAFTFFFVLVFGHPNISYAGGPIQSIKMTVEPRCKSQESAIIRSCNTHCIVINGKSAWCSEESYDVSHRLRMRKFVRDSSRIHYTEVHRILKKSKKVHDLIANVPSGNRRMGVQNLRDSPQNKIIRDKSHIQSEFGTNIKF